MALPTVKGPAMRSGMAPSPWHMQPMGWGMAPVAPAQPRRVDAHYEPIGREISNFNGRVSLSRKEAEHGGETVVWCRHLAYEYFRSEKKLDFLGAVKNEAGIKKYFSGGTLHSSNEGSEAMRDTATLLNTRVLSLDMLPTQISEIAATMIHINQKNNDFMLNSGVHSMALNIKIQNHNQVCVSFYDPNCTNSQLRIEANGAHDLQALSQLVGSLQLYRQNDQSHAFSLRATYDIFQPQQEMRFLSPGPSSTPDQLTRSAMFHAHTRRDPALAVMLLNKAVSENPRGLKETLGQSYDGMPYLAVSLEKGHTSTVESWMKGIRKLVAPRLLTQDDVFALFKAHDGVEDGFVVPLRTRNLDTIKVFMAQVIKAADEGALRSSQAKALFSAPEPTLGSGFNHLWFHCDHEAMAVVAKQLGACYAKRILERADIKALLQGPPFDRKAAKQPAFKQEEINAFKLALQPLIDQRVLRDDDVKALFASHGFDKPAKGLLSKILR
ncbi:ShET2/EspL2 family type III secretion system effector toxin [Pseudomonas sp. SDO5511_1_S431]